MPKYDYICNSNDCEVESFEVLTTSFDNSSERCPGCKQQTKNRKSVYQFSFRM